MTNKYLLIGIILLTIIVGCDKEPNSPDYQKEVVIFGYLWGNERLSADRAIMISHTQPLSATYNPEQAVIHNATVTITDVSTGIVYELHDDEKPGYYFNDNLLVKPKQTYLLQVAVDGKKLTASTTVPPILEIETELEKDKVDTVYYDNISREKPIFIACESADQIVLIDAYCNEPYENAEFISPFWGREKPDSQEEYDDGSNGEPRHIFAVVKFEELNSVYYSGQNAVDWYSSMIQFYGSYTLQVMAIDDNYHRFVTNNEYPEFKAGINGGIGVFGSCCGETFRLQIMKR